MNLNRGVGRFVPLALLLTAALIFYARGSATNPPGFFLDESSIAFNAYTISESGVDENGESFPLYFRAFGEYKNPVYIYLLAAVFRITGPSIAAARFLSAVLGVLTVLVLTLLGEQLSGSKTVGILLGIMAMLTPWLFELSRLVLEVAAYPLATALLLLLVWRASRRTSWTNVDAITIGLALALLTYTYSIGRLLAPMLAVGLFLFATTRSRLVSVARTLAIYAVTLVPLFVFNFGHPGALTERFKGITYMTPASSYAHDAVEFVKHFAGNFSPFAYAMTGDPSAYNAAAVNGTPLVLAATFVLAAAGLVAAVGAARADAWWRFVLYGLAASAVPASLTNEYVHTLRLAPVVVFLLVLTIPSLASLVASDANARTRRGLFVAAVLMTIVQGGLFLARYDASAADPKRRHIFDAEYPSRILAPALALPQRPVYLYDGQGVPGYMQAYWHATLQGVPISDFERVGEGGSPPDGSTVIMTRADCDRCRVIAEEPPYVVYVASKDERTRAPIPEGAFHAEVTVEDVPASMKPGSQAIVRVSVKNAGDSVWPGRMWKSDPLQVGIGNHWLDEQGHEVIHDDGRAPFEMDVLPGESRVVELTINAPKQPGVYMLEVDVLQEGVSWFALKGSKTARVPVHVAWGWLDW